MPRACGGFPRIALGNAPLEQKAPARAGGNSKTAGAETPAVRFLAGRAFRAVPDLVPFHVENVDVKHVVPRQLYLPIPVASLRNVTENSSLRATRHQRHFRYSTGIRQRCSGRGVDQLVGHNAAPLLHPALQRTQVSPTEMINNACPPLHKRPCVNNACTGQRLPDPRTCGQCEPVPIETEHTSLAELAQLPATEPKRRGRPPRARAA